MAVRAFLSLLLTRVPETASAKRLPHWSTDPPDLVLTISCQIAYPVPSPLFPRELLAGDY